MRSNRRLWVNQLISGSRWDGITLFEKAAAGLGGRRGLIQPYALRRSGKVERGHWEDQKCSILSARTSLCLILSGGLLFRTVFPTAFPVRRPFH